MKLAIIGCTGLVGSVVLKVLDELSVKISDLTLVASPKSTGKKILFEIRVFKSKKQRNIICLIYFFKLI